MKTYGNCVFLLINLFLVGVSSLLFRPNAAIDVNTIRLRRQAGYVYDRPSLSFDLPSRTTVGSTSTQAPTVDRISAQQMYYAYPVPAGGSTSNGYSSAAGGTSTAISGSTGYDYGAAEKNSATGTTGTVDVNNYNVGYSGSGSASTVTSDGSAGYNYDGATQNTASMNTGGGTSTATSGSGGYNYEIQNTGSQTNTNSGLTGYPASTTGNSVIPTYSVSTKAPEYLPPTNLGGGTVDGTAKFNTQSGYGTVSVKDSYIPPSTSVSTQQKTPSVTITPTRGYIAPSVNVVTQTSSGPVSAPKSFYLTPNSDTQTLNNQNTQAKVTKSSSGNIQQKPVQEYLPPVSVSQGPIATPAAKYLPPVFK